MRRFLRSDGRVSSSSRTQVGHRGLSERELLDLAATQHGVVSLAQLGRLGLSASGVRSRVAGLRLHPIHRTVYAVGRRDLTPKGRWMAAVLACGDAALLSHWSAASLRELLSASATAIDVTITYRSGRAHTGLRVHRCPSLAAADIAGVDGIPCTSLARTLLDVAAVAPRQVLERACDRAEMSRSLDMREVAELLKRVAGQPGSRRLAAIFGVAGVGENVPANALEEAFQAICRRAGLPQPEINVWLPIPGEELKADFVWRDLRLVAEVDGFGSHGTHQAFRRDRRRDRVLHQHGWTPARFARDEVFHEPRAVAEEMRGLYESLRIGAGRVAS